MSQIRDLYRDFIFLVGTQTDTNIIKPTWHSRGNLMDLLRSASNNKPHTLCQNIIAYFTLSEAIINWKYDFEPRFLLGAAV